MSKLLELLNLVRYHDNFGNNRYFVEEYQIIETALKRLEELEIMYSNCVIEGAKQKKALEIVKEKDVSMYWLRNSKSVDEYNNFILTDKRQYQKLTQEEYDLLKEVLGE